MANKTQLYSFTGREFEGHVLLEYDEHGYLMKYDATEAQLNIAQTQWLVHKMPRTLQELRQVFSRLKNVQITKQVVKDVDFEMFWSKYNDKSRSSKKKSRERWNRLSKADQVRAYNHIPIYFRNIPPGIAAKYAETYLNHALWDN